MTDKPLGIGLIGAGLIGCDVHAPVIARSTEARLVAVCDVSQSSGERLAARYAVQASSYSRVDDMLRDPAVEAVIVATPNRFHREAVEAATAAGRHVFCEKPIAHDVVDAEAIVAAADRAGVVLQLGFNHRFWTQAKMAKALIAEGVIGPVHAFRSVYSAKWDNLVDASNYRYNLTQSGGATMMDLTIHRIDLIRHLLGQEFTTVAASLTHSAIPPVVDDNTHLLAHLSRGASGTLSSDRFSPALADSTELYGSDGSIHMATEGLTPFNPTPLAVFTTKPLEELPPMLREHYHPQSKAKRGPGGWDGWISVRPPRNDCYAEQLQAFVDLARGREPAITVARGADGLAANRVIHASYASQREGRWMAVPLPSGTPFTVPSFSATRQAETSQ